MNNYVNLIKKSSSETRAYNVIKNNNYERGVCESGVPLLHLENKTDEKIISMIKKSNYNRNFLEFVAPFIKKKRNRCFYGVDK
jgi:hypothetical protein